MLKLQTIYPAARGNEIIEWQTILTGKIISIPILNHITLTQWDQTFKILKDKVNFGNKKNVNLDLKLPWQPAAWFI